MHRRLQQTLQRSATLSGIGFLTGADVRIRFLPAEENCGVAFQRLDLPGTAPVAACLENVVSGQRRTVIAQDGVAVMMIEHVMAALAGLQIDNCLVQLNAPEPPGFDGSAQPIVDALLQAGIAKQGAPRKLLRIRKRVSVAGTPGEAGIVAEPGAEPVGSDDPVESTLRITYELDYGPESPVPRQTASVWITPDAFLNELAFARTFVLESEVAALRAQGFGLRLTARDLLVFGPQGVIDNRLRAPNECARHKILDCVGDFALIGCDLIGTVNARRSGHQLNHDLARRLRETHQTHCDLATEAA